MRANNMPRAMPVAPATVSPLANSVYYKVPRYVRIPRSTGSRARSEPVLGSDAVHSLWIFQRLLLYICVLVT